ncbi:MAG: hypothetical protein LBS81_03470 [Endomicrobium sp.]|nr:hypothetical protein [Endomicrobium sp.]
MGGTWNDTNKEKALAFSDEKLFTVIGIWKDTSDLQFMVFGQHHKSGHYLYKLVVYRKRDSRSTQSIPIQKLIKDYKFNVICPPDKKGFCL